MNCHGRHGITLQTPYPDSPHRESGQAASVIGDQDDAGSIAVDVIVQLRLLQARSIVQRARTGEHPDRPALFERRLRAVESLRVAGQKGAEAVTLTREDRMDLDLHRGARRREHSAPLDHAQARMRDSWSILDGGQPQRVVLAHRNPWFRGRTAQQLRAVGIEVVAEVDDGAEAVGVVLVGQPDLALVEELLPSYTGLEVLRRLKDEAPAVQVAVHLADSPDPQAFLALGACAVFSRRRPPAEVGAGLVRCLASLQDPLVRV